MTGDPGAEALPSTPPGGGRRRLWRVMAVMAVVAVLVLGGLAFIVAHYFAWPASDAAGKADAVVVLSGDQGDRLALALQLMHAGTAPVLVLDGDPDYPEVVDLCRGGGAFEVVCLRPAPDDTRAEAQAAAKLAEQRGWARMVVVTSTQHGTRAGLLFRRCFDGSIGVVRSHPPFNRGVLVRQVVREFAATAYALVVGPRGC